MISVCISIILLFSFNQFKIQFNFPSTKAVLKAGFSVNSKIQDNAKAIPLKTENSTKEEKKKSDWYLEIPKIQLKADIQEGTTKEVMDEFIGHFEESQKWKGNVCLAAHNRGYKNNYFAEVKTLKKGDEIIYYYQNNSKKYYVQKNDIIKDEDLSCLENTQENTITLITCVENEPNYRRCIRAIEVKN